MTDAQPTTAAARQRRCRRRRRLELLLATAEVPRRLVEKLVSAGFLCENDASNPREIGAALTEIGEHFFREKISNGVTHKAPDMD